MSCSTRDLLVATVSIHWILVAAVRSTLEITAPRAVTRPGAYDRAQQDGVRRVLGTARCTADAGRTIEEVVELQAHKVLSKVLRLPQHRPQNSRRLGAETCTEAGIHSACGTRRSVQPVVRYTLIAQCPGAGRVIKRLHPQVIVREKQIARLQRVNQLVSALDELMPTPSVRSDTRSAGKRLHPPLAEPFTPRTAATES